jgi:hypothetical protein
MERPIARRWGGNAGPAGLLVAVAALPMVWAQGGSLAGTAQASGQPANEEVGNEEQPAPTAAEEAEVELDELPDGEETIEEPAEKGENTTKDEVVVTEMPALPETTTPALRSNSGPAIADAATEAETTGSVREYLNQGNPLLLGGLAALCCIFLLLWGRKRRLASRGEGGAAADSGADVGATPAKKKISSKVQYSRIADQFEAESPFSRGRDDSDDYDDEDEDGFGQERDKWDDWEPEDSAADPNPFAAPVGLKFPAAPMSAPSPVVAPAFKISPPPVTPTAELQEIVVSSGVASPPADSVGSNSSSDSFEVVTDESAAAMPHSLFPAPAKSLKKPEPEEKKQSVDDLFSVRALHYTFAALSGALTNLW